MKTYCGLTNFDKINAMYNCTDNIKLEICIVRQQLTGKKSYKTKYQDPIQWKTLMVDECNVLTKRIMQ